MLNAERGPTIFLYDEASGQVSLDEVEEFLGDTLPAAKVERRARFADHHLSSRANLDALARQICEARVADPGKEIAAGRRPFPAEVEYEKRVLTAVGDRPSGILYDGFALQEILVELIPRAEATTANVHIVLTDQLIGTWDAANARYHARVSVYGLPSLISAPGVIEGPARPKEYYLQLQLGRDRESLKERFRGRFADYGDPRLTEIVKGYVLQAMFYALTGDPFCQDRECRLFNAHWQEDMLNAQLGGEHALCATHREALDRLALGS